MADRLGLDFFLSELRLLFGRRRNQLALAVLAGPPLLISIAVKSSASRPGREAPDFFSSITQNGLFVALAALTIEMALLLPLAVSLVSGDSIAGEAHTGTLRYLLTVPVGRRRLLLTKYLSVVVYVVAATLVVTAVGVIAGLVLFGGGSMTTMSGTSLGAFPALLRVVLAALYLAVGLSALAAVGLLVSTLTEQPLAAMLVTVVFSTASFILDSIPQVGWLHPYLVTHQWAAFADLFRAPIAWTNMVHGLYLALAYIVVALLAAAARFQSADVTS